MTTGSGLYLNPAEKDPFKISSVVRQLIEGRSNAVGVTTLTHDGSATSTAVTAVTCGPNSVINFSPQTSTAAAAMATTFVQASDIQPGKFVFTHSATSTGGITFSWMCSG